MLTCTVCKEEKTLSEYNKIKTSIKRGMVYHPNATCTACQYPDYKLYIVCLLIIAFYAVYK